VITKLPIRVVPGLEKKSSTVREFGTTLSAAIVGTRRTQKVLAGVTVPDRPIANLHFLGPTKSGKTRIVGAAAGDSVGQLSTALIKVDLRRVSAQPRDCETDRIATGIHWPSRDFTVAYLGI
jgi:hypothetical protein